MTQCTEGFCCRPNLFGQKTAGDESTVLTVTPMNSPFDFIVTVFRLYLINKNKGGPNKFE